ncbi:MAG: haloacid dehalogenase type II [Granulosicoccus sp.]
MSLSGVNALLFDVFGTVVDWRGSITAEMQRFGEEHKIEQNWQQFALDWRALYQPAMETIRSGHRGYVKLDQLHRENLQQLLAKYGLETLDETTLTHINQVWHRLQPWADVLSGMNRLKKHYILASLSNGNVAMMVNMARHSAIPWDMILGSETAQGYKPQPKVYLHSARMLDLEPEHCLMVAAHNSDLQAARLLGFKTAYINRPYEYGDRQTTDLEAEADWDIVGESMTDIASALDC